MSATAVFIVEPKQPAWTSASFRMEIWATVLGSEVATVTIALLCYDWSLLRSPLP